MKLFQEKNKVQLEIKEEVKEFFFRYSWPGNVRELSNLVERVCLLKGEGLISEEDLPEEIKKEMDFSAKVLWIVKNDPFAFLSLTKIRNIFKNPKSCKFSQ